ncbi:lytic murein transglycosylase [Sphingomonas sp. S1-29]|uniref:lytic murein transglycosylase n=1 Tax=Sphingomonas sp. S1-29 TaxID=2991074 RepID=UPI0022409557|nr:lytic murein transglycosylase [Sphingomonas sp. S1-29]UZK70007.1 lytic murein transglycosylase [Sphingomonas sp. S1-29]
MRIFGAILLAGIGLGGLGSGAAAQDNASFQSYLATVRSKALREGVSDRTLNSVLPSLTVNPRVIELDRDQPGSSSPNAPISNFAPYRARHVDAARIGRGRSAYRGNLNTLRAVEQRYGVPGSILVAIWGHETNYGGYTGDFDLPRSLATLAFEGRRRPLFEGEFIALLKIIDRGVPRDRLKGSWAGAMGYPQFLPSVYLRLAVDGDGDGDANIWANEADALASIGNYLSNAGWRRGQPWGVAVNVPAGLARAPLETRTVSPRCPRVFDRHSQWRTIAEWRALGVTPQGGALPADNVQATLLEPDGQGRTAFLLTSNYRVILDYNCSNFYALSVGLLADEVSR